MTLLRIIANAPGIIHRAKHLRRRLTKEIRKLKRADPGLDRRFGCHEWWELQLAREQLEAVRWVLFGEQRR